MQSDVWKGEKFWLDNFCQTCYSETELHCTVKNNMTLLFINFTIWLGGYILESKVTFVIKYYTAKVFMRHTFRWNLFLICDTYPRYNPGLSRFKVISYDSNCSINCCSFLLLRIPRMLHFRLKVLVPTDVFNFNLCLGFSDDVATSPNTWHHVFLMLLAFGFNPFRLWEHSCGGNVTEKVDDRRSKVLKNKMKGHGKKRVEKKEK